MLNFESPPETQFEGIRLAREIDDLSLLIMPPAPPSVWECCAEILCEKSDSDLEPYLTRMLEWLDDLNWPGALTIFDRLKIFSGDKLKEPFVKCVISAAESDNTRWMYWLSGLLDNEALKLELPQEMFAILERKTEDGSVCPRETLKNN